MKIRYLLVCPIGWHQDADGEFWTERLWAKDLLLHFEYLTLVSILAPRQALLRGSLPSDWVKISPMPSGLNFIDFPIGKSIKEALFNFPRQLLVSINSVSRSDVVHSGAAGWPIPPGLVVNPLAFLFGKPLVIVIESAFWRNHAHSPSLKAKLRHRFTEAFAKWSCRRARLAIFTHRGYFEELLPKSTPQHRFLVSPASWIDVTATLTTQEAIGSWERKGSNLQFLVAARMEEAKGVSIVMMAIEKFEKAQRSMNIDFIGEGSMKSKIISLSRRLHYVKVNVLDPVPYGTEFFALIRRYHALLVPTISDEQPRIIFDSHSQAVSVIASNTVANQEIIISNATGLLYDRLSAEALLEVIESLTLNSLRSMGLNSVEQSRFRTHEAMHFERANRLCEALDA